MQKRKLSTYEVVHECGRKKEIINAASVLEVVSNLAVPEEESPITSVIRTAQANIPSLFPDEPSEVNITVAVNPEIEAPGCYATPYTAHVHAGDVVTLEAIAAHNYQFTGWKINDVLISTEAKCDYTVPEPEVPGLVVNIYADFKLADIEYTIRVDPPEAVEAGCAAGPSGKAAANSEIEIYAVTGETYKFDGWFLEDSELGKEPVLKTNIKPLEETELAREYVAKYSLLP